MAAVSTERAQWRFNPFSQSYYQDPYSLLRRLRDEDPVHWAFFNMWVFTKYVDIIEMLRDRVRYSADHIADWDGYSAYRKPAGSDSSFVNVEKGFLVFNEASKHTRFRNAMRSAFKPDLLQSFRPAIQRNVDVLLDKHAASGRIDIVTELAEPLATRTLCEILGVPPGYDASVAAAAVALNLGIEPLAGAAVVAAANHATQEMRALFMKSRDERKAGDPVNLMSALLEAESQGAIDLDESFALWATIVLAGSSTAINGMANGVLALLRHPAQFVRLREDPSIIRTAVNEILRYDTPGMIVTRAVTTDTELRSKSLRKGQLVMAFLGAANRDPEIFADPDQLIVDRKNAQQQIAFGQGVHFCLGEQIARVEIETVIRSLVERFPNMRLGSEEVTWHSRVHWRGLRALPVQL
jgi:cytochrome P450